MMKKVLLCCLLLGCTAPDSTVPKPPVNHFFSAQSQGLVGSVKSLKATAYMAIVEGDSIVAGELLARRKSYGSLVEEYSTEGYMLSQIVSGRGRRVWMRCTYDSLGRVALVERNHYDEMPRRWIYDYEAAGDRATATALSGDGDTLRQLSYHWRMVGDTVVLHGEQSEDSAVYATARYDSTGRLYAASLAGLDLGGTVHYGLRREERYEGRKGERIDSLLRSDTTVITSQVSLTALGNMAERRGFDGRDSTTMRYEYRCDSVGNWVEQVSYRNGAPQHITKRTLQYYEK